MRAMPAGSADEGPHDRQKSRHEDGGAAVPREEALAPFEVGGSEEDEPPDAFDGGAPPACADEVGDGRPEVAAERARRREP